uniref:Uncharacterized protein n=1 Tax=Panagrolaimus sp. JU765 TaxID=591449 RepID=A0AC34R0M5_9BILA
MLHESRFKTLGVLYRQQKPRPSLRERLSHPETAHSTVSLDVTEPEKSVTKTRNPEFLKPDHPQIQKQISSSSTLNSISTLSKPGNSKTSSNCTISTTISAPNSTRTAPNRSSELDLSGPLSRLQMTGIPEKKQEISLTEKLSKSFFDLTQGSQDRLQKWKNKLQNGKKMKFGKDMSEPPDLV